MLASMGRFPFPVPYGWFQVAYPDDVAPGEVKPLRYFGRDLVLYRDEAGEAHVLDAICPHLGAHLGYGGSVQGDQIQCPFHGWRFDGAGTCTEIPYSDRLNKKAKLHAYPVIERNGLTMVWYHPNDADPLWEVPELKEVGDPAFTPYYKSEFFVASALQEMAENTVDPAHFRYVHGTDEVAVVEKYEQDGPLATMLSSQSYVTPRGVINGRIDVYGFGPGFTYTWFTGIIDALLVAASTPVDDEHVHARFNFTVRNPENDAITSKLSDAFVSMINLQMSQDIPIWEHKEHLPVPALADTDGPIMQFRRWYQQFYAE